ncbi:MAG: hypothetical protein ISS36_03980 [Candidatus Aenigmarchaeota archaeon]|nr:hypothetical protein [Candidatus Aenigmarchaeota archaeon]
MQKLNSGEIAQTVEIIRKTYGNDDLKYDENIGMYPGPCVFDKPKSGIPKTDVGENQVLIGFSDLPKTMADSYLILFEKDDDVFVLKDEIAHWRG